MREVRESHNDVTFIDEFLSAEFVLHNNYFTYEYSHAGSEYRVASTAAEDVKKKLLLQFTNFGKPSIAVYDGNFANRGELLLGHRYNGIALDLSEAKDVLERVFDLWGRPVNLMTIRTEYDDHELEVARRRGREPEGTEVGVRIRYDGETFDEYNLEPDLKSAIEASEVDYDTKPDEWLA
jgi:stage V sporulation protein R